VTILTLTKPLLNHSLLGPHWTSYRALHNLQIIVTVSLELNNFEKKIFLLQNSSVFKLLCTPKYDYYIGYCI